MTTIATVANTVEEKFAPYYDRFMPSLKYIVQNANTPDYRLLRGKTIECISFIGLAVGKEKVRRVLVRILFLWWASCGALSETQKVHPALLEIHFFQSQHEYFL